MRYAGLLAAVVGVSGILRVEERGGRYALVEEDGRERLFRGVNLATLGGGGSDVPIDTELYRNGSCPANNPRWYQPPLCESDVRELAAAGFDSVRLLVHWSQIEPTPGVYDTAYFARINQIIDWAEDYSISVLIDFHQDNYGNLSHFCCANDGAPPWAWLVNSTNLTAFERLEIPLLEKYIPQLDWSGAEVAFQDFWENAPVPETGRGLQVHYITAVAQMVNATMGRRGVIGYELMNEPLPGLDINLIGFSSRYLYPFYARLIQALTGVRDGKPSCGCKVAADFGMECPSGVSPVSADCAYPDLGLRTSKLMVFEPMALRNQLDVSVQISKPFSEYPNIVYAPHAYSHSFTIWKKEPYWVSMDTATREAAAMHAAVMVTEWGGNSLDKIQAIGREQEMHLVNGLMWCWKQNGGGGWSLHKANNSKNFTMDVEKLKAVSRVRPTRIAATLQGYGQNASSFWLQGTCGAQGNLTTDVYIPTHFSDCSASFALHGAARIVANTTHHDGSATISFACTSKSEFQGSCVFP
eukprot:Hpha_TRINITY_DN3825_c0_g1::TRINITY_DN3825_c0_g1_i1::g.44550::m.44550/K05991/E3.2.1.123; endoglycosylceramidase